MRFQDGTASAFIPHNSDSAELIHIATGHSITSATSVAAAQLLDAPDTVEDDEGKLRYHALFLDTDNKFYTS